MKAPGVQAWVERMSLTQSGVPWLGTVPLVPEPHILIVDDASRTGWLWAAALRRAGFRMSIAADADEGWRTLDEREFALLITSQDATGRSGVELIAKARGRSLRMPCILVRDLPGCDSAAVVRMLHPGMFLEKTVTISRLLAVVRRLLAASADQNFAPISAWGFTPFRGV